MYRKYVALLEERGVTTSTVCEATGISESAMSMWKARWIKWEEDKVGKEPVPSLESIVKLAQFFKVPIEFFLGK